MQKLGPHVGIAIWEAFTLGLHYSFPEAQIWLGHALLVGAAAGAVLYLYWLLSSRIESLPAPTIILPPNFQQHYGGRNRSVAPIALTVALAVIVWSFWTFWIDRVEVQVDKLRRDMHVISGISTCAPNCINVDIEGTEPLAAFTELYDLIAVCRAHRPGIPFWQDDRENLNGSRNHPLQDGIITVIVGERFIRRVCEDGALFECIPALVSRDSGKVLPINPGLRTDADCDAS